MTNHAFASSQGRLTAVKLRTALEDIVAKRFPGVFNVTGEDKHGYYDIEPQHPGEHDNYSYLSLHLRSQRMIEMRKGHQLGSDWVQTVIQNELAHRFKGKCSDEGLGDERWEPKLRFFKYKEYFELRYDHLDPEKDSQLKEVLEQVWKADIRNLNKAFHDAGLIE